MIANMQLQAEPKASAPQPGIYRGDLRHRRFSPISHIFTYKVGLLYVNIDNLDSLDGHSRLLSSKRTAIVRFDERDYLPSRAGSLKERAVETIFDQTGARFTGDIYLLTSPRFFGVAMNPISCFYCFNAETHTLEYLIAEVTNTPWKNRVAYVLTCDPDTDKQKIIFEKTMHVSPFNPMDMHYHLFCNVPRSKLFLHIENHDKQAKVTDATLTLDCTQITKDNIHTYFIKQPFYTLVTGFRIYWHALKLKLKGSPFYSHPKKHLSNNEDL